MKNDDKQHNDEIEEQEDEQPVSRKKQAAKYLLALVALLAVFGGLLWSGVFGHGSKDATPESTSESVVESTKESKEESASEESSVVESESEAESESKEPEVVNTDMTDKITAFFTAYQEYDESNVTANDRADKMKEFADESVVKSLVPDAFNGSDQKPSLVAAYEFTSPVEVQRVGDSLTDYTVVLHYVVEVGMNSSKHVDSYSVKTEGDKITDVIQRSFIVE